MSTEIASQELHAVTLDAKMIRRFSIDQEDAARKFVAATPDSSLVRVITYHPRVELVWSPNFRAFIEAALDRAE